MNYLTFLETIRDTITGTTTGGTALSWYNEICLEDEIELRTGTTYPAFFLVPIPFDLVDNHMARYACKIYMVDEVTRAPNYKETGASATKRIIVYNRMINYAQAFLQQLADEYINDYPITINPIVKWDANVDGIYFELVLTNAVVCLT